jgi:23S rRNA (adenine2503-C2)-methyltransferase
VKIAARYHKEDLASVTVVALDDPPRPDRFVEVVESVQPPIPRRDKWVVIVSTLAGCPIGCAMCDAGRRWAGKLTAEEILGQIDLAVDARYPDRVLPQAKFKIQFARMGEPTLNPAVLEVLRALPSRYAAPGLLPSISTVAPRGCDGFLDELAEIKDELFAGGRFQMQFSVHSTDPDARHRLIPVRTWDLARIAAFGRRWVRDGDRRIALNFAAVAGAAVDPDVLAGTFDPALFLIKLTPVNPTVGARDRALRSAIDADRPASADALAAPLRARGFQVIVSIGELEENQVGSNCGQFVTECVDGAPAVRDGYDSQQYLV